MYVVTETSNVVESGKAFIYENEEDGIQKLKETYREWMKNVFYLDRDKTYINEECTYAQVSDGVCVNKLRLIKCA